MFSKFLLMLKNKILASLKYFFTVFIPKHTKAILGIGVKKVALISIAFFIILGTPLIMLYTQNKSSSDESEPTELTYNDFMTEVNKGNVDALIEYSIGIQKLTGRFKDSQKLFTTDNPQSSDFKKMLLEKGVKFEKKSTLQKIPDMFADFFSTFFQMILFIIVIAIVMGRIVKQQTSSTGSKFDITKHSKITFDDVAGNEEAKENMMELVDFLTMTQKFTKYGVIPPKGTILFGHPGTGKTLLAKALAGTADVPFIAVSGSDFVEKYVGVGASRIRQLFKIARKTSPCIIFIDEIDAIGKRSTDGSGATDERDRTLNQLLVEIDGFSGSEGIIVIAATNRLDMLDQALLRSGRFDRQIQVSLPDVDARYSILKLHARNKPIAEDVDFKEVAKMTVYMSGADLANVMNEAGIYAIRHGRNEIHMKDIDLAISKIHAGEEKKNKKNITQRDNENTAYHEAGHVLVAKLLSGTTVTKVTIIPTTKGAGGYTLYLPDEKMYSTKKEFLEEIAACLGGRAAEEIIFGEDEITNGASADIKEATRIASNMVKHYGMSSIVGLISIPELNTGYTSDNTKIEDEIKTIIENSYKIAKDILINNQDCLNSIAKMLLEKETIYRKDIDNIIEKAMFQRKNTESVLNA